MMAQNDIQTNMALVRDTLNELARTNRDPSAAETLLLVGAGVNLLHSFLLSVERIADSLDEIAARGRG